MTNETNTLNFVPVAGSIIPAEANSNPFVELLIELVEEILKYLPFQTVKNFSWASKECRVIALNFWDHVVAVNLANGLGHSTFVQIPKNITSIGISHGQMAIMGGESIQVLDLTTLNSQESKRSGVRCLTTHNQEVVYSSKNTLEFWDLSKSCCTTTLINDSLFICAASDQQTFVSGDDNGNIKLWDLKTGSSTTILSNPESIHSLTLSGNSVVAGDWAGNILLVNLETRQIIGPVKAHPGSVCSIVVYEQTVYTCGQDVCIKKWELNTLSPKGFLTEVPEGYIACKTYSEFLSNQAMQRSKWYWSMKTMNGKLFACSGPPGGISSIEMFDLQTGQKNTLSMVQNAGSSLRSFIIQDGKFYVPFQGGLQVYNFAISKDQIYYSFVHRDMTPEECVKELGCTPEVIQQMALQSPELQDFSEPLHCLDLVPLIQIEEVEEDLRKAQPVAYHRRETLKNRLAELAKCSMKAWTGLHLDVMDLQDEFEQLVQESGDSPQKTVAAFSLENYNKMAAQLNRLIEDYNSELDNLIKAQWHAFTVTISAQLKAQKKQ
ncbi:MAG TPA: hypothetical protein VHK67_04190 [Rhabdochlamydiaceae bacterium]|jgi:hypothetical protein|nr:hypothetical protein [Rhabdochlamydiaceae bacterium]